MESVEKKYGGYSIYLMIQLAIANEVLDGETEYDTQWTNGNSLYEEFLNSKFNDKKKSEYDCINEFLNDKKDLEINGENFTFYVNALEINRYEYTVKARSNEEGRAKLEKYFEIHGIPYADDKDHLNMGVRGVDREAAYETRSIESIF